MNKVQTSLGGLLVVQFVLALGLFWGQVQGRDGNVSESFVAADLSNVDRIEVEDAFYTATLARDGEDWILPELNALPVSDTRIETLLSSLETTETGWPVATSADARTRFQVAEDDFQRSVRLYSGDQLLGEYFLGTSPGFGETHARRAGEDEIYAVTLNNFDLYSDDNDWMDKSVIRVSGFTTIAGSDYELREDGEDWTLADSGEGERLNREQVDALVAGVSNLGVRRVAEDYPEEVAAEVVVGDGDRQWRYEFMQGEETYYIRRADMDIVFTVSPSTYTTIAGTTRTDLIAAPESEQTQPQSQEGSE